MSEQTEGEVIDLHWDSLRQRLGVMERIKADPKKRATIERIWAMYVSVRVRLMMSEAR